MTDGRLQGLRQGIYRLQVLTAKELLQLMRDILLLVIVVYAFTVDIFVAGSGLQIELRNAALTIVDYDGTYYSRELGSRFQKPYFNLQEVTGDYGSIQRRMDAGETMIALVIPSDFTEDLAAGKQTSVQVVVDTTNSILGSLGSGYAAQIIGQFGFDQALQRFAMLGAGGGSMPAVESAHRLWFNPNAEDRWFMPVTELMTIITLLSILLPAAAMVREKERGTVEQLLVSPLSPMEIMLPKVIAMTAVILIGSLVAVFGVLQPIFDVPFRGSYLLFFALTAAYVFTSAGFGLAISTITNNLAQVGLVVIMLLSPMLLLSGTWVPPEAMPVPIQYLMLLSPLHYYIDIGFGVMLKGVGLSVLWPSVLGMLVLGSAVFVFGALRFRRQFAG